MDCPSCSHPNPEDASYCGGCGAALARETPCSCCGRQNAPGQKFCHGCGARLAGSGARPEPRDPRTYTPKHLAEKILTSRSALEGERKQVTVLFADVQGSVDLSSRMDAEEWHRILDRFFQILTDGVHRFEGTVNQYTGDGIMALFGAPIAHEDHAQRACYAALHLRDRLRSYADELRLEWGFSFSVRMGMNSGEVVVGSIGDDLRMDYTAQGHTVGLAARMQEIGEPGRVYLTEHTAAHVQGYFQLRDLGRSRPRGVSEAIRIFELEGVGRFRTRLDVSRARGFSRFVGRTDEMSTLETALSRASHGEGQVVAVVGEAGLGKSRLCDEFVEQCRARGTPVYEVHCPSHGQAVPFLAALELLRGYFGIGEHDDRAEARRKIAGTLVLLDEGFREILPLLFDLLGVTDLEGAPPRMDPEARERRLFAFVRQLVRVMGQREPALLLVDDAHWIDRQSDAVLAQIVEAVRGARTLLVVNFRPEYRAAWLRKSHYEQLPIRPLAHEEIRELLRDLLGSHPSVADLPQRIIERTKGNPFFIEEAVLSLVEGQVLSGERGAYRLARPIERFDIPAAVQPVVAARIDRLPQHEKRVLQTAAVVGKKIPGPVLESVCELSTDQLSAALAHLQAAEFLYETVHYPEPEYAFKHPLTQEVAYRSQLSERRAQVHAAVARSLEESRPEKLDEHAPLLAYHYELAGDRLRAARWHQRSAGLAEWSDAVQEHLHKVCELTDALEDSIDAARLGLGARIRVIAQSVFSPGAEAKLRRLFEEGRTIAERLGHLPALCSLNAWYGNAMVVYGRPKGHEHLAVARQILERIDHPRVKFEAAFGIANGLRATGRYQEAADFLERYVEADTPHPLLGVFVAQNRMLRADVLLEIGRPREARAAAESASRMAVELREPQVPVWAAVHEVFIDEILGEPERAVEHARRAVELAERWGNHGYRVRTRVALGLAHRINGQWEDAVRSLEKAHELTTEATDRGRFWEPDSRRLGILAEARLGQGETSEALRLAEESLSVARSRRELRLREALANLALARVLLRADASRFGERIEQSVDAGLKIVRALGAVSYEPLFLVERARITAARGDAAARKRELREAHRLFTEMGATGHAEQVVKGL